MRWKPFLEPIRVVEVSELPEMLFHVLSRLGPLLSLYDSACVVPFSLVYTVNTVPLVRMALLKPTSRKQQGLHTYRSESKQDTLSMILKDSPPSRISSRSFRRSLFFPSGTLTCHTWVDISGTTFSSLPVEKYSKILDATTHGKRNASEQVFCSNSETWFWISYLPQL